MSVRDENYEWKDESEECTREINKMLKHIFEKYGDKFSLEDLYYLVCTEADRVILFEVFKRRKGQRKK